MTPLAESLRPLTIDEIVGQNHLVGPKGFLRQLMEGESPLSLLFWGPPGCGKTTLARLYTKAFPHFRFYALSAVQSGIADIKKILSEIEATPLFSRQVLLFIDEIHRFNKAQQDIFLPFVEKGTLILIGATTENPSFSLNAALLSRLRVLEVHSLGAADLEKMLDSFEQKKSPLPVTPEARKQIIEWAQGDGRYLFNLVEGLLALKPKSPLSAEEISHLLQKRAALFDREGEHHYRLISALHKSVRGSDPQTSLYWFARMLEGGEDPLFLARRLIRMAVEDIGLADPEALKLAIAAKDAYEMLGSPEGELALAEVVIYLALAPKSNALYVAYKEARKESAATSHLPPPKHILNAPTKMMESLGYGENYAYDHDTEYAFSGQAYFPENVERSSYYRPVERGFEREMKKRLLYFEELRKNLKK